MRDLLGLGRGVLGVLRFMGQYRAARYLAVAVALGAVLVYGGALAGNLPRALPVGFIFGA